MHEQKKGGGRCAYDDLKKRVGQRAGARFRSKGWESARPNEGRGIPVELIGRYEPMLAFVVADQLGVCWLGVLPIARYARPEFKEGRMKYQPIEPEHASKLLASMKAVEAESGFMAWGPGERTTSLDEMRSWITAQSRQGLILGAFADGGDVLAGYLSVLCRPQSRLRHCGYIVIGVRQEFCNHGIGTGLMQEMVRWSREQGLTRLELTVIESNHAAQQLYRKIGFQEEGRRRRAILLPGGYTDELHMGLLL